MSYATQNTLQGCITSLSTSVSLLGQTIDTLDAHTEDFSRLKTILAQRRVFTLVPEHDLNSARRSLEHEIEPKIVKLVDVARAKLAKLERRRDTLLSKVKLNEARINNLRTEAERRKGEEEETVDEPTETQREKLKELRLRKKMLEYNISSARLRKSHSRLSMAFQQR